MGVTGANLTPAAKLFNLCDISWSEFGNNFLTDLRHVVGDKDSSVEDGEKDV